MVKTQDDLRFMTHQRWVFSQFALLERLSAKRFTVLSGPFSLSWNGIGSFGTNRFRRDFDPANEQGWMMARYYYDLTNGRGFLRDDEGAELEGPDQVRGEVSRMIRGTARDETALRKHRPYFGQ